MAAQPVVGCNADATALKEAGNVAFSSGKHLQAFELFSEAILKDPSSALLRSNRAGALASLGRHDEAFADADTCCKLQPDWWKGYTRRGHAQFHLKDYQGSEMSFLEALRLNPSEKSVFEALAKTRAALYGATAPAGPVPAGAGPRAAGAPGAPPTAGFSPPPAGFVPAGGAYGQAAGGAYGQPAGGVYGQPAGGAYGQPIGGAYGQPAYSGQPAGATPGSVPGAAAAPASSVLGPSDFHRLSADELRNRLEMAASKLSDEALDTELRLAGVTVPKGATREAKVKLYCQTDEQKNAKPEKKERGPLCPCLVSKKPTASEGEKLLEMRKKWVEEWSAWDDEKLVKRLAKLGIDGDGLARAQLVDELLSVETERYSKRCDPARIQKIALAVVGAGVGLTFVVTVIAFLV